MASKKSSQDHQGSSTAGEPINVKWKTDPDPHDYPAAADYLSLLATDRVVKKLVADLKKAPLVTYKAKDLLRSSRLPLLGLDDPRVRIDVVKVFNHIPLAPVLVIRGDLLLDIPLTIADGYHRVCTSYHLADNTDIPCRVIDLPVAERLSKA
jgi:hypothetical protein